MLKSYLAELQKVMNRGDAREESYYTCLEKLLHDYAEKNSLPKMDVTVLPKKTEAGNPDFRVWDGKHHVTGYIEAKDPGVSNLDRIEGTEQIQRYINTFPNVILTNFYEFRLYRDGTRVDQVMIARSYIARDIGTAPPAENEEKFFELLDRFLSFSLPRIKTARQLALDLAKRTRFLRDEVVSIEMAEEAKEGRETLLGFYKAFKKYLISTITEKQFADLYAQTLTYGLFAARTRSGGEFNRELAFKYIPNTIGILRDVFRFISLEDPPEPLRIIVDDIAEVLHVTDVNAILHRYFSEGKGKDPVLHFYETFLAEYDPGIRERRGVYYTPEPVVGYIVRSIHHILKTRFGLADGLASPEVTLLDPAGGTLTFPAEAIRTAYGEYIEKHGTGGVHNEFFGKHILPHFYAFELMMAPYAVGHLKMSFLFEELGYRLGDDDRFNLYLTNTLEMEELDQIDIPGLSSLSEESHLAGEVKKKTPILVILGNPPYSGHSVNRNEWTERLLKEDIDGLQSFYRVDGEDLGEKNPKWLQDDYVKFLRFAQWKVQKAGFGVVGMITNHSYLDNPTFRGMRQSLMKTFNEILILDLHGNSLKRETCPDGSKDENVFDIRQGTAIVFFIKEKDKKACEIRQLDLYGLRKDKYNWLEEHSVKEAEYEDIEPASPYYFFIRRDTKNIQKYLDWKKINEIFPVNSVGIVTARDKLTIKWSEDEVWNTVVNFSSMEPELARRAYNLGKDTRDWKVNLAQEDLKKSGPDREKVVPILYRPFDIRYTYYTGHSRGFHCRPRPDVMRHMLEDNIGMGLSKRVEANRPWEHAFISEKIITHHSVSLKEVNRLFPLYIYPEINKKDLFSQHQTKKEPNIPPPIFEKLETAYRQKPSPEDVLYYSYGVFYSNIYRETYREFLKIDFPRIPFTASGNVFREMGELGRKLGELHLLKSPLLDSPVSRYQGSGDNDLIEKYEFDESKGHVIINRDKYFDGITPELWNYHIGGYQVLRKYLKDRKGRNIHNPRRYCRIVTAIHHTIEIQNEIDELYEQVEENLIDFS